MCLISGSQLACARRLGWGCFLADLYGCVIFLNWLQATHVSLTPPCRLFSYFFISVLRGGVFNTESAQLPLPTDVMRWGLRAASGRRPPLGGGVQGGGVEGGAALARHGVDRTALACSADVRRNVDARLTSRRNGDKERRERKRGSTSQCQWDSFLLITGNRGAALRCFLLMPKCFFFFCLSLSLSRSPFFVLWVFSCHPSRVQLCPSLLHSFLVRYCFTAFVCLFNLLLFAKKKKKIWPSLYGFSCRYISS